MKKLTVVVCSLALGAVCAAQIPVQERPMGQRRAGAPGGGMIGAREFIVQEGMMPGQVLKGAPFSADTYTELKQTLGDGNVIERKKSGATYRDSEGRVRIEQPVGPGVLAGPAEGDVIVIRDPVAGVQWTLNPTTKTGVRFELPPAGSHVLPAPAPGGGGAPMRVPHERSQGQVRPPLGENRNVEDLGTQNINGVPAEGTRITMTIPAGRLGNVRPIEIVNERWYSPQLQMVVKSRNTDPRTGDHLFEMTNIRLVEPAANLFQPPADYRIEQGRTPMPMQMQQQMRHQPDNVVPMRRAPATVPHEL